MLLVIIYVNCVCLKGRRNLVGLHAYNGKRAVIIMIGFTSEIKELIRTSS